MDNKRQEVVNVVEQKFQRLSLPANNPSHSQVMFSVEQMGAGGSAIAAAASQAIAATQQVSRHSEKLFQYVLVFYEARVLDATGSKNCQFKSLLRSDQLGI